MTEGIFGGPAPTAVPGTSLTPQDMARVTADDWHELRQRARAYCRTVDATRSRKRANGSATVVKGGHALYGTDDASDDVAQDAVLLFAQKLRDVLADCPSAPADEPGQQAWTYTRRNGAQSVVSRDTLRRWAVHDAARRNGYRVNVPPGDGLDAQAVHGVAHADSIAQAALYAPALAQNSAEIFRLGWGDGSDFPTLRRILDVAEHADDLGRAGIFARVAQQRDGGAYGARRKVLRARDDARTEWRELSERLDEARTTMIYGEGKAR